MSMRQKGQTTSLAQRLNNALAEIHSLKMYHQQQTEGIMKELEKAREEIDKQKSKIKQLKRQIRQQGAGQSIEAESEVEQCISKIRQYMSRIQQSSHQLTQVASECSIIDAQIEQAAAQIQKNMMKSSNGLIKYIQQLMRRWISKEKLRLQNERLQKQNRRLFDLTNKLQQNFKDSDRIIRQLANQTKQYGYQSTTQELHMKIQSLELQNRTLKSTGSIIKKQVNAGAQQRIHKLQDRIKHLQQQNTTVNASHERALKKLQDRDRVQDDQGRQRGDIAQTLQQERRQWLIKSQQMYQEIRALNKQLLQAEGRQNILNQKIQFYMDQQGEWQQERSQKQSQIIELQLKIQAYLCKMGEMEINTKEIGLLSERLEEKEEEKEKIVSVYQLEVQQLNDQIFSKQDTIVQLQAVLNRQRHKHDQIKKQYKQVNKDNGLLQEMIRQLKTQDNGEVLQLKELQIKQIQISLQKYTEESINLRQTFQNQMAFKNQQLEKQQQQNDRLVHMIQELKDECLNAQQQLVDSQSSVQLCKGQVMQIQRQLQQINKMGKEYHLLALITATKDKFNSLTQQLKNLKLSHQILISEAQIKQENNAQQLQKQFHLIQSLKQQIHSQRTNAQAEYQIWRTRIVQQDICQEEQIAKTSNIYELIKVMEDSYKNILSSRPTINFQLQKELQQKQTEFISLQKRFDVLQKQNEVYKYELQTIISQNNEFREQTEDYNAKLQRYEQIIKLQAEKHEMMQNLLSEQGNQLTVKTFKISEYEANLQTIENQRNVIEAMRTQFVRIQDQQQLSHEQAMQTDYDIIKLTLQNQQKCNLIDELQHRIKQQINQSIKQQSFIQNLAQQNSALHTNQLDLKRSISQLILQKEQILTGKLLNREEQCEFSSIKQQNQRLIQANSQMTKQKQSSEAQFNLTLALERNNQISQSEYFQFKEKRLHEREVHLEQRCKDVQQKQCQLKRWTETIQTRLREVQEKEVQIKIRMGELQQQVIQVHQRDTFLSQKQAEFKQQRVIVERQQQLIAQKYSQFQAFRNLSYSMADQMENIKAQNQRLALQKLESMKQTNIKDQSHAQTFLEMAMKIQQSQNKIKALQINLDAKGYIIEALQSENNGFKHIIQNIGDLQGLNTNLSQKIRAFQQQINHLNQDLYNKQALLQKMEASKVQQQAQKMAAQQQLQQLRLKLLDYQRLVKQNGQFKIEMESIKQQNIQIDGKLLKHEISHQEQERVLKTQIISMEVKMKESLKSNQETVKQLEQQINTLKSSTKQEKQISVLDRQPITKSILHETQQQQNLPLQVRNSRLSVVKIDQEGIKTREKYQQELELVQKYRTLLQEENKFLKTEMGKYEKVNVRLRQCQKNNSNLVNEMQVMKAEVKSKTLGLQILQKQFKSKSEEYSKLQRLSESIKDELNLQKKRVKNFQQLYHSLQLNRSASKLKIKNQSSLNIAQI